MASVDQWLEPPARVVLERGQVHVWRIVLSATATQASSLHALLSEDERRRAAGFHFERDRSRFIVARAQLRLLLARYLDTPASALVLGYGRHGKPFLPAAPWLRFNLSHSDTLALLAVAREQELGVDTERHRVDLAIDEVAPLVYSLAERAALRALPRVERVPAFYRLWTRKESFIKAVGEGLSMPLHGLTVSLGPGPEVPWRSELDAPPARRWSIYALPIDAGYSAALTVDGAVARRHLWQVGPPDGVR